MKEIIKKVYDYLDKKYSPDVIILYGSYARGDYNNASDVDCLCITKTLDNINDTSIIEGKTLDVWIKKYSNDLKGSNFVHIKDGIVLKDTLEFGINLLKEANDFYLNGFVKKSNSEKQFLIDWMKKMNKRAIVNDAEGLYRGIWLVKDLLEIYFDINDLWYEGPKKSLTWLKENDSNFYNLYIDIMQNKNQKENIDLVIRLLQEKVNLNIKL